MRVEIRKFQIPLEIPIRLKFDCPLSIDLIDANPVTSGVNEDNLRQIRVNNPVKSVKFRNF